LLANVSHELRTPLARIRVALDIASEGDTEAARESLGEITEDLNELEQIVDDVLQSARLELLDATHETSSALLRSEEIDAQALVDRSVARFATRHPKRTLDVKSEGCAGVVVGDARLLRRALDNLLDNAEKYSDAETTISLHVRGDDDALALEVEDHGIGIERNDLAHVGTPFFRTDRSRARTTGGIGLGLSLTRRIAEAHGGSVAIESEPGIGTRVRITVPRENARAIAAD
jgi:signal transduction histidine kinase